ncbi:transcription initiation factor IIB [Haloterrigena sp. SYSU A558-1]|uniref:Transcription initiation factor IIB n=1 Tax=Haloterrigena gelatinilytica TaxID=2741724 RepID=A0ABX2L9X1_9EURY|nr:transcription initiation factor IIB [Haloterrigena gelatinilytica]NUC71989.1 transcription initiation factor IIB [Haloterrigena gelatinilytica]
MVQRPNQTAEKTSPNDTSARSERRRVEEAPDASERTVCPECESASLLRDGDQHEVVCGECGLVVVDETIDYGPEWRAFTEAEREDRSRAGAPTTELLHDKGLTTTIDWRDRDAAGRMIEAGQRDRARRLRMWQQRAQVGDARERNLRQALGELSRMASALGVPRSVQEIASTLYQEALDADLLRGRSIEGIATAALYAACRQEDVPRSLDELARVSRVDRRRIGRAYRYIAQELELAIEPIDPELFLPRFCSALELGEETRREAQLIVDVTAEEGLHSGRSPVSIAAAAVYLAARRCGRDRSQEEVADVAQVTVPTVRHRYQEQAEVVSDRELTADG